MIGRKKPPVGAFCLTSTMASKNTKENTCSEKYKNREASFSEHDDSGIYVTSPTVGDQKDVPVSVVGSHDHCNDRINFGATSTNAENITQSTLPTETLMMKFQLTGPPCPSKKKKTVLPAELLQSVTEKTQRRTLLEASSHETEAKNSKSYKPVESDSSSIPLQSTENYSSTDNQLSMTKLLSKEKESPKIDSVCLQSPAEDVANSGSKNIHTCTGVELEYKHHHEASITVNIEKNVAVTQAMESSISRPITISQPPVESFVTTIQLQDVGDNASFNIPVGGTDGQNLGTNVNATCQQAPKQQIDVSESQSVDNVIDNDHSENVNAALGQSVESSAVDVDEGDCNVITGACQSTEIGDAAEASQKEGNEATARQTVKTVSTFVDGDDIGDAAEASQKEGNEATARQTVKTVSTFVDGDDIGDAAEVSRAEENEATARQTVKTFSTFVDRDDIGDAAEVSRAEENEATASQTLKTVSTVTDGDDIGDASVASQTQGNKVTASQTVKNVSTVVDGDDACIPLGDIHVDVLDDVVADDDTYNISALFSDKFDQAYKKCEKQRRKEKKRKEREKKKQAKYQYAEDSGSNKDDEKNRQKQNRKKPIPNYFVSVQITNIKIKDAVQEVQDCILHKNPDLKKTLIALPKLHLTLFVMLIETDEDMERAKSAMDLCAQRIYDRFETELVTLDIRGIGDFRNEVVFAKVHEGRQLDNLTSIADMIHDCFVESGVPSAEKKGSFKPHITIAKMSKAAFLRHKGIKKIERHLYEEHADRHFGHQVVTDVQLCAMLKPKDKLTGYYQVESRARFAPKARNFSTLNTGHCLDDHDAADIIVQWSVQSATEIVSSLSVNLTKTLDGDMCHNEIIDKNGEKETDDSSMTNCIVVENLPIDDVVASSVPLEDKC